jgi:hypothetical protein
MLLHRIEKFLSETGMPWTKFGRIVAHDPRLVGDMRNGRQPRPELAARIDAFINPTGEYPCALISAPPATPTPSAWPCSAPPRGWARAPAHPPRGPVRAILRCNCWIR